MAEFILSILSTINTITSAELLVSAVLPVLFEKLASRELLDFATQQGVRSKLRQWEKTLKMIVELLIDAEEKQEDRAVKMWLDELQDLAYDAEDILDEYATEALIRKLKIEEHQASTSRARKLIPACCIGFTPSDSRLEFSKRSNIDDVTRRLEDLCRQSTELGLEKIEGRRSTALVETRDTTCFPTEDVVYGRDQDKANILDLVFEDEPGDANFGVIPIVGMGGIGKTTLVKEVYNDDAVKDFDPKAWVCVSDDFDVLRISNAILRSITRKESDYKELNLVHVELKELLNGKKFLLVLDDVWSNDDKSWQTLKSPFMFGALGSKVIVTTRLQEVASTVKTREYYKLDHLSDDNCWSLFKKYAIEGRDNVTYWNVEVIRQKVVQKCKGLPLAARTLGGLLRRKDTEAEWIDVLDSKIWDQPGADNVLPVLKLSYNHLPSYLKRCFAYCAIFPKDYEFEMEELVLLWMAEGLIQQSAGDNKQLEKLGGEYFLNLLSRSIFQISNSGNSKYIMHELVNDLAQKVSEKVSFRLEDELFSTSQSRISDRTRYASYLCQPQYHIDNLEVFNEAKHLRTHLSIPPNNDSSEFYYISDTFVPGLLSRFKKLRVLSLQNYKIVELPDSIGSLRLLRYLNLSNSKIISLPESINLMCNLQTLILRNCDELFKWPCSMENLINLRHLDFFGASSIQEMPLGIRKWECLRTLSNFIVGKSFGSSLNDLKHLKFLWRELHISRLENVIDLEDILRDKKDLRVLLLEWGSSFEESRDEEVDKKVLDLLPPHQNLDKLTIKCYGGTQFSYWVGDPSYYKMTVLELVDCWKCTSLPSLGLLGSLKSLTVKGMNGVKSIGSEFYGEHCSNPFQSLETLYFENLERWECWDPIKENESFPKLQELSIVNCPKLSKSLPKDPSLLKKLVICNCAELVVSLSAISMSTELEIDVCKKIIYNSPTGSKSLNSTTLSNISDVGNWLKQDFQRVEVLIVNGSDELIQLWQNEIVFENPLQGLNGFNSLRELDNGNGKPLTTLLEGINQRNAHLEELQLLRCPTLMFIFRGQLPPYLKKLCIINCEKLQYLLDDKEGTFSSSSTSHLEELYIYKCPSLRWLPSRDQLSATLTRLHISHCSKLTTLLSRGRLPTTLKELKIHTCSDLTAILSRGELPEMLETLEIADCPKLKSIVERFHNNFSLRNIYIQDCPNLVSFPKTGFSKSNLVVWINQGQNLKYLASQMPLASLQFLVLCQCPKMSFPTEGLPSNLTSLEIEGPNLYKPLAKWGLHKLTSLRQLSIKRCPGALSFPEEEMKLPPTLTHLRLENFLKLKSMSSMGFQNLSSLEELRISDCPNLASLPRLSSSILRLDILNSPLLKEACKKGEGREWPNIAPIPCVVIDSKFINDPEEEASAD